MAYSWRYSELSMTEMLWSQEHEAAGHVESTARKQQEMNARD